MDKCKHQIPWDDYCLDCHATTITAGLPPPLTDESPEYYGEERYNKLMVKCFNGGSSEYYDLPPNCKTLQDVIEGKNMNWSQANIFKAAYRWDIKPDLRYNLEKIKWFNEDKIKRLDEEERTEK